MSLQDTAARVKAMTTGQLIASLTILVMADPDQIDYEFVRLAKEELEAREPEAMDEDECNFGTEIGL